MESCADMCCQRDECDVAMVKNGQCHLVGCPDDQSCQMEHSEDTKSELMFLTGRKKKRQGNNLTDIVKSYGLSKNDPVKSWSVN